MVSKRVWERYIKNKDIREQKSLEQEKKNKFFDTSLYTPSECVPTEYVPTECVPTWKKIQLKARSLYHKPLINKRIKT